MGERLRRLRVVDIGPHTDLARCVIGQPVGPAAIAACQPEALRLHQFGQRVPQARRCLTAQQGRLGRGLDGGIDLTHIEHTHRTHPDHLPDVLRPATGVPNGFTSMAVDQFDLAGDRTEDLDRSLPAPHLMAHRLPRPVTGDHRRVRLLQHRQHDVVEETRRIASDAIFTRVAVRPRAAARVYRARLVGLPMRRESPSEYGFTDWLIALDA